MSFGYQTTEAGPIVSDHVTAITPPGRPAHGQAFDALHEQTSYVPPALSGQPASDVRWTYDAEGRVDLLTIGGASVDFRYASASAANAGHLTSVVYPGHTTSFTYESTGAHQLESVTADAETLTFGHAGPLPTSVAWSGTVAGTVSYGYDSFWQLASIAVGGTTSLMSYDADGALDCVTSGTAPVTPATPDSTCSTGLNVDLALEGTPQVWHARTRYPGNTGVTSYVATDVALSRLGDLASATSTWAGSSTSGSLSFSYGYDSIGRIHTITETNNGGTPQTTTYDYDTQGRLTTVTRGVTEIEHYTYDANGNRLTAHAPGVADLATGQITTDARDRLTAYGTTQYTYNAQGQLATRFVTGVGTTTYTYDLLGALRSASLPDGHVITYRVDAMGRRIERARDGNVTARWVYLDGLRPVAELDGTNAVRSVFVYGEGRVPSLMIRGGVTYRIITDHVGTVRRVINPATGAVVWSRDYDSFGNITSSAFAGGVTGDWIPFGFAGGLYDEDTGLVRFGARDYEPRTGTWTAADPIGFDAGDGNLYRYCGGDPLDCVDPAGLDGGIVELLFALVLLWEFATEAPSDSYDPAHPENSANVGSMCLAVVGMGPRFSSRPVVTPLPHALRGGRPTHVYFGIRGGRPVYVGISVNVARRLAQHGSRFERLQVLTSQPIERGAARAVEQAIIERYPTFENLINSISPAHAYYREAVAFGESWLRSQGL